MSNLIGKYGSIYLPDGTGTTTGCLPETVSFSSGLGQTTHSNIEISKITTDAGGNTKIHDWYYATWGFIYINSTPTGNRYVWYRYYTIDDDLNNIAGFYDWTLNINYDIHDSTHLSSSGTTGKGYILGHHDWNGSAPKYWIDSDVIQDYLEEGDEVDNVPFIIRLYASNSIGSLAYWSGLCNITGMNTTIPVSGIVDGTINFQGISQNHCKLTLLHTNLLKNSDFALGSASTATYWTKSGDVSWDSTNKTYLYLDSTNTGYMEQGYADFNRTALNSKLYCFQYTYATTVAQEAPQTLKIKGGAGYFAASDVTLTTNTGINYAFFTSHSSASTSEFRVIATSNTDDGFSLDNMSLHEMVVY